MIHRAAGSEQDLRRLLVKACKALDRRGLVAATDGNLSARLPSGRLLATPSGVAKGEVEESSLVVCDAQGRKIRGAGEATVEINLHVAAYRERPDVLAVVHAHPPIASAFTYAGKEGIFQDPILPEVAAQIGPIPAVPYATPGTRALADAAAPYLRGHDVILLTQHGALALGSDPWAAYLRMEKLEQAAVILKAAWELAGSPEGIRRLTPEQVAELIRRYRNKETPVLTSHNARGIPRR